MAGNSQRKGARRATSKKGAQVGSGGKRRQGLSGRGKTLPADERPWHKSYSGPDIPEGTARKQARQRRQDEGRASQGRGTGTTDRGRGGPGAKPTGRPTGGRGTSGGTGAKPTGRPTGGRGTGGGTGAKPTGRPTGGRGTSGGTGTKPTGRPTGGRGTGGSARRGAPGRDTPELLVGRNPVVEALRAHVPATTLYVAQGLELDDRIAESVRIAGNRGIPILEVSRGELTRMLAVAGDAVHQGIGLAVPPFNYEPFEDIIADAAEAVGAPPLLVGLDGVTDPRNLGAVVRSAAAFGAHGVFLPERRSAGMTATAWRASAGAATRLPLARVTNLSRALKACQEAGFVIAGLDADGEVSLYDLEVAVDPLVIVVGSEGRGLSRLVGETCDMRVRIPMVSDVESLNASVAAAVTLAEVTRRRTR